MTTDFRLLLFATLAVALLFHNSSLDLWAARFFYHPGLGNESWHEENNFLWSFFYFAAPWFSGLLLLGSLIVLIGSQFKDSLRPHRKYAAFVFLVVFLGSGFLINTVLKPYWGRPRPREVVELGGNRPYRPFYLPDLAGPGKSFPCGHCSVGFSYGLLAWILRRKKNKLSQLIFGTSLLLGLLMGVGRIAAGGHFLSDVFFAGLIIYWTSFVVYYFILKIPVLEQMQSRNPDDSSLVFIRLKSHKKSNKKLMTAFYGVLAILTIGGLMIATPFHSEYALTGQITSVYPDKVKILDIELDNAQVEIRLENQTKESFRIDGVAHGFGFPGGKLNPICDGKITEANCAVRKSGFFSDLEHKVLLTLNINQIQNLNLKVNDGSVVYRTNGYELPKSYLVSIVKK